MQLILLVTQQNKEQDIFVKTFYEQMELFTAADVDIDKKQIIEDLTIQFNDSVAKNADREFF